MPPSDALQMQEVVSPCARRPFSSARFWRASTWKMIEESLRFVGDRQTGFETDEDHNIDRDPHITMHTIQHDKSL